MENSLVKRPPDCKILIVDDEKVICDLLEEALSPLYKVISCKNGKDAFSKIDSTDFDIIVTDLKLPDVSGLDVLSYAKAKDEYTEVIVVTGYASLDTATVAINLGVYSYMIKPLAITDFLIQVERAVASRLFHLKSLDLMRQLDYVAPDVKVHLHEITSLYFFIRKLMLSLEIPEIMRITLEEANARVKSVLSVMGIDCLGYREIFAMPSSGEMDPEEFRAILGENWRKILPGSDISKLDSGEIPRLIYKGRQGDSPSFGKLYPLAVPMIISDRTIGTLTVFLTRPADQSQFLYVFTSIVASIIEHGYSALQARQQAKTDSLTGVANHRLFHETLEREIARANRKKSVFSLVLIDIDNFKNVNDTYGHQTGDAVIVDLTKRVLSTVRGSDVLARYGGEEFGIILPDTDRDGAEILADRVLKSISSQSFTFSHNEISYTVSIGMALYDGKIQARKDALIAAADKALYASKRNGRNRVTIGAITHE